MDADQANKKREELEALFAQRELERKAKLQERKELKDATQAPQENIDKFWQIFNEKKNGKFALFFMRIQLFTINN